ncbi:Ribokinase-like protein [Xylaria sp. FL1777]|nr:Ribokinase-like protein [Xylaria sp. FL1777]
MIPSPVHTPEAHQHRLSSAFLHILWVSLYLYYNQEAISQSIIMGHVFSSRKLRSPLPHGASEPNPKTPCFVSLGMTILEKIDYQNNTTQLDIPGGPGLWATFGARLFKYEPSSADVGCIIVARKDYPPSLLRTLESWKISIVTKRHKYPCTRAGLQYTDTMSNKSISYLSETLQPSVPDLEGTLLLGARAFHFAALPSEMKNHSIRLNYRRRARGFGQNRPLIVWEPAPVACEQNDIADFFHVLPLVDVFSPSHEELISLTIGQSELLIPFSHRLIQELALRFVDVGIGPDGDGLIIVRCGSHGCFYMKSAKDKGWVTPYYAHNCPEIKDVTGARSAFLGAFTVCFERTKDVKKSCLHGIIASSFAIEQFGLPVKTKSSRRDSHPHDRPWCDETWNDDNPFYRLGIKEMDPNSFFTKEFPN